MCRLQPMGVLYRAIWVRYGMRSTRRLWRTQDEETVTEIQIDTTRKNRYGVTRRTHVSITQLAHDQIQTWADEKGVNFSVAIESLALIGLGQETAETLPLLVTNMLERILARQFNRFAKLISLAAIAAEEANWKADTMLLQLIRREALADPEKFIQNMVVSTDPKDSVAAQIRRMREEMKAIARDTAVKRLKKPLQDVEILLCQDENGEEVGDG